MREVVLINSKSRAAVYGIGTYTEELIHCLRQLNINVTIVELDPKYTEFTIEESSGIRTLSFPFVMGNGANYFARVAALLRLNIQDSSDVVFQFNYSQKELLEQIKTKYGKARTIVTVHYSPWGAVLQGDADMYRRLIANTSEKPPKKHAYLVQSFPLEKEFFEKADTVIALSDDTASMLTDGYGVSKGKIFTIANGLRDSRPVIDNNKAKFRKQFRIGSDETVLLSVGRLDPAKGIGPLLLCFKKIVDKYDNCRLVLVGDGDISILKSHSKIASKVIITGKVSRKEVAKWYAIADIGLFPSFCEECSYVGIEMMMHSLPVVASDSYGVRCMFRHGQNALVAERVSTTKTKAFENNLFENISLLIESRELRDKIASGSRTTYEQNYRIDVMQKDYKQLLDKQSYRS